MNRIWQEAAGILETAASSQDAGATEIAILIDGNAGLRIVDASGWQLEALKREYSAATAYSVKRSAGEVVVQAKSGTEQCTLQTKISSSLLSQLTSSVPRHLVHPEQVLLP